MKTQNYTYALDADELQFHLWNVTERVYASPRMMVQFSLWLDVTALWGLRTGEFVESSTHRAFNEGAHYGDVNSRLVRRPKGLVYEVKIRLRNHKFARDDKSKV